MDWLNKTDPNVVIPLIAAIVGWAWHRIRGDKRQSLRDQLDAAITAEVHQLVQSPQSIDVVRVRLRGVANDLLARIGTSQSATVKRIVEVAIEEGIAELAELANQRNLAAIAAGTAKAVEAFTPPRTKSIPNLDISLVQVPAEQPKP